MGVTRITAAEPPDEPEIAAWPKSALVTAHAGSSGSHFRSGPKKPERVAYVEGSNGIEAYADF